MISGLKGDLHLHTTASDGRLSPKEVVKRAASLGLEVIAITDHDTVEGVEPALAEAPHFPHLLVIPGVELSAEDEQEVHVLGYFIDINHAGLRNRLKSLHDSRVKRGKRMVSKLAKLGLNLEWDRILALAHGGSVGRPHIAQAMLERGYVSSIREAFEKYIGHGGPAYVERERLTPTEAVSLIAKAGGLPAIAHPAEIRNLELLILELKGQGLVGLEVYYPGYSGKVMERLRNLAQKHGLLVTGGSDFHGFEIPPIEIGQVDLPGEVLEQLFSLARQRHRI